MGIEASMGSIPRSLLTPATWVWQPADAAIMLLSTARSEGKRIAMNNGRVQFLAFVVLAAIILGTGFGALGAPLAVAGGW